MPDDVHIQQKRAELLAELEQSANSALNSMGSPSMQNSAYSTQNNIQNTTTETQTQTQTELPDLTADTCVDAIIAAGGNRKLAAERLHTTESHITATIASDPTVLERLGRQVRVVMLFDTMASLDKARLALISAIAVDMEPKDVVRAYEVLARLVVDLTDTKVSTTNVNVTQQVMNMLPPQTRQAVLKLIRNEDDADADDTYNNNGSNARDYNTRLPTAQEDYADISIYERERAERAM